MGASMSWASVPSQREPKDLSSDLHRIQDRILLLERHLVQSGKSQDQQKGRLEKIRSLISLLKQEKHLGEKRMKELESWIGTSETRRAELLARVSHQEKSVRLALAKIYSSLQLQREGVAEVIQLERWEVARRKVLSNIVHRSLREIEGIRADIQDVEVLEEKISQEKQNLAFLFNDLKEQEALLQFHEKLQQQAFLKDYQERMGQLERYRGLKESEGQIASLIQQFHARKEFEEVTAAERSIDQAMMQGAFVVRKGYLPLPVVGPIVSHYGPSLDPGTQLKVFKKGVEIRGGKNEPVRAVFSGRLVYSGVLPRFGQVAILDHGGHYYSLCAQLGRLDHKTGDYLKEGEAVGLTDGKSTPIYFEIRHRNVPVNPLQWLSI